MWHTLTIGEIRKKLKTNLVDGLTDEEVNAALNKIIDALSKKMGAELRK